MTRCALAAVLFAMSVGGAGAQDAAGLGPRLGQPWRGIVFAPEHRGGWAANFEKLVTDVLEPVGINVIVFDMFWHGYRFRSRPEFARVTYSDHSGYTRAEAGVQADIARRHGMRVMVGMNCLTHQNYGVLFEAFPELREPGSEDTWCPLHPEVNEIAYGMIDELLDAFHADGFHVGMDEGWGFHSKECERCCGQDPAELFAKCVKDMHRHIVEERGVEMLMWGDMLLDWHGKDTKRSTDMIPKDIIICDWHYDLAQQYPSVRWFQDKGFRVWPCGWNDPAATLALIDSARLDAGPGMLGHLYTTWCGRVIEDVRPAFLGEGDQSALDGTAKALAAVMRASTGRVEAAPRTRIEILSDPVAGAEGRLYPAGTALRMRASVSLEGNYGVPVTGADAELVIFDAQEREVLRRALKTIGEWNTDKVLLGPGDYRPVVRGTADLEGPPRPRDFLARGPAFRVVGANWRADLVAARVKQQGLADAPADIAEPPEGGRLLGTLVPAEAGAAAWSHRNDAWLVGVYEKGGQKALVMSFPAPQGSAPGDYAGVTMPLTVPRYQGRLVAQLFLADLFLNPGWPEYRFYQLLIGDNVVWEEDITADRSSTFWTAVDITDAAAPGTDTTLAIRVYDKRGVGVYPTTSLVGPVRLVEARE